MLAMIVDDNEWVLAGISRLLQSTDLNLELQCFNNTQDALAFALRYQPAFIIVDVEMPAGNGLDMCRRIMQEYSPKLIVISGHERFQYAQQAIRLGAVQYILKPIKQNELLDAVRQVVRMIEAETRARAKHAQILEAKFFLDLAAGRTNSVAFEEYLRLIDTRIKSQSVALCLLHIENHALLMNMMQKQPRTAFDDYREQFDSVFREIPDSVVHHEIHRGYFLFMVFGEPYPFEAWMNALFQMARKHHCIASAGISQRTNDPSRLGELYKQAVQALQREFSEGTGKIHRYQDMKTPPVSPKHDLIRLYDYATRITNALSSSHSFQCPREEIANLFDDLRRFNVNQEEACLFCQELLLLISTRFMHILEKNPSSFHSLNEKTLRSSRTIQELKARFEACMKDLYENIHYTLKTKSDSVKLVVDQMLQTDCASVSLETVAEKLNVHPTYLSILFKEAVGVNFKTYVLEYKMKMAKQMLMATDMPVHSISDKLGYMDAMYFSRIFKKQTGMTPGEYRRSLA